MWHKAAEPYVSTNRNHYNRRADPAAACDDSKWVESPLARWPPTQVKYCINGSMGGWTNGWTNESIKEKRTETCETDRDGAAAVKDRQIRTRWRVIRELVCTTVLLSELNWFISGGKYQPEWKKRKVCQFLKVQRGEGEKCFAAFPSSMPNCSEPFSICNPESTWKNFAWSKSNMNGDVSAGVHALIFGVYAENKCMLFVSCAPLCAVCTFVRVYICEEGKDGSERRKKSDGRVNIPVPLLGPITL